MRPICFQASTEMSFGRVLGGGTKDCRNEDVRLSYSCDDDIWAYTGLDSSCTRQPCRTRVEPGINFGSSSTPLTEYHRSINGRCVLLQCCLAYLIPHTINDCPRRQSPAANTPSMLVEYFWWIVSIGRREKCNATAPCEAFGYSTWHLV